jgi:anti-sigma B factor antagonist
MMHFVQQRFGDVEVLSIKGKLIGSPETDKLHERVKSILADDVQKIVLDLKHINWLASLGMGALMRCVMTARSSDGDLYLAGLSEKVKNLFAITKLVGVVKIFDNVNEAVNAFDTKQN